MNPQSEGTLCHRYVNATCQYVHNGLLKLKGGTTGFTLNGLWKTARLITEHEACDGLVVELAALLHDIADSKFHDGDEESGKASREFLVSLDQPTALVEHVEQIIRHMSFKGGHETAPF